MLLKCSILLLALISSPFLGWADNLGASAHIGIGQNRNPTSNPAVSAGIHFDPAFISRIRSETFEIGLAYDKVQQRNGATVDVRWRIPFAGCYWWEFHCTGKRFWLVGLPSIGKRWGQGGMGGFISAQVQAVYDFSPSYACCRLAVGFHHRFPFDSTLHGDNVITIELRSIIGWRDRGPRHPPPEKPSH